MTAAPKVCPLCGLRYDAAATFCQKDGAVLTSGGGDDPFLGRIVLGQFRIDEPIGSGGMGSVYRAHQTTLGRDVAIKILHPELAKNSDAVRRFHREARVATSLEHPNLVRVFLFGELPEDGNLYLVMEHLAGRSLVDVIDQDGVMPVPRAMHVITQICDAIGVAHAQGIVHRDVKPENVMLVDRLGDTDFVKVLDFGIARMLWDQQTALTQSGVIFGTARYISPEGASGEATDARSDVYSIGILAYQLLAGVTPFEAGSPVAMLMKHIHDPAPALRSRGEGRRVPQVVADVVMRALAKNPDMRYDDAGQLARALRDAAELAAIPVAGIAVGRGSYRPSAPTAPPPNAPRPHAPPSGALASSALAPAAPRPRREPTPTAPVRRENTDAIVANIPGLPGRPRWPTMLLAFAIAPPRWSEASWLGEPRERRGGHSDRAGTRRSRAGCGAFRRHAGRRRPLADGGARVERRRRRRAKASRRSDAAAARRRTRHLDRARARRVDTLARLRSRRRRGVGAACRAGCASDPELGLHLPSDVRAGDEVTLEVVLGEGTYAEGARFELYRGNRRVARLDAVRAGVERRWLGTTTIRTSGSYEVRFTVGGLEEPVIAPLEVSRASNAPRRSTETPRTTVLRTTPQTTAMEELPPPVVVEDDGIDWTIPANMGGATMTSTPPPDPGAPPPWTG
ncbi:MAG: serine/threonine protein kinase [Sandaracinus sp.]|nr:serine/threonine protein kinase [Sandaracinus sp.]